MASRCSAWSSGNFKPDAAVPRLQRFNPTRLSAHRSSGSAVGRAGALLDVTIIILIYITRSRTGPEPCAGALVGQSYITLPRITMTIYVLHTPTHGSNKFSMKHEAEIASQKEPQKLL